jgi:sulfur relay (sulfurtransferase) DsrC/TusE family protein
MKNSPQLISFNDKNYEVHDNDYLINPQDWDEDFALKKAQELKMGNLLTEKQ